MDSEDLALFFPVLGLAIGSTLSTMGATPIPTTPPYPDAIPFGFSIASWLAVFFVIYKGINTMAFMMLGVAWGTVIGAMANVVPFDMVILAWLAFFFIEININDGSGQSISPTRYVLLPLVLIVIGGTIYLAYPDFSPVGNGFPTNWQGCITTCTISAVSLLPETIFAPLASGNIVGFVSGLFSNISGLTALISLAAGVILLLIGLGIGGAVSVLGSGVSLNISESGQRLAFSLGLTTTLYGVVNALFSGWYSILSSVWGLNVLLPLVLASVCFYGAYLQAKVVAH